MALKEQAQCVQKYRNGRKLQFADEMATEHKHAPAYQNGYVKCISIKKKKK